MAISTYSELKTAVADWSHRSDLTSKIPDFVRLAESRINRSIKFNQQETETSLTATIGSRYINLPSDFIAPMSLWLTFYGYREVMTWVPVDKIHVDVSDGQPEYWTIDGARIAFDSTVDQAYTYDFRYVKSLTLSDSTPTNWILTNHPDVYLYASLMELAAYIRDSEQLGVWTQAYQLALQEVLDKEHRTKAKAVLFADEFLSTYNKSNIFEG